MVWWVPDSQGRASMAEPPEAGAACGRLIECVLGEADVKACGSKYSCFELVDEAARACMKDEG